MKRLRKSFSLMLLVFVSCSAFGQTYDLVWSDEFNGSGINTSNWNHETGGNGWGNNELQYYTSDSSNSRVEGGNLVIEARQESYGGSSYTSARLTSQNKVNFTYGRVEARIQVPSGQGLNPSFWMMPEDFWVSGWPACGEIDIMETANQADFIYGSIHYGENWPNNLYRGGAYSPGGVDFSDAFHTYSLEWEESEMRWYVDDNLFFSATSDQWWSSEGPEPAPFNKPFFMILNLAVGGNWPGLPDASTEFPNQMLVDYVRVYEAVPEPTTLLLLGMGGLLIRKRK
jgi:beta-glucanase (GH16 family)